MGKAVCRWGNWGKEAIEECVKSSMGWHGKINAY